MSSDKNALKYFERSLLEIQSSDDDWIGAIGRSRVELRRDSDGPFSPPFIFSPAPPFPLSVMLSFEDQMRMAIEASLATARAAEVPADSVFADLVGRPPSAGASEGSIFQLSLAPIGVPAATGTGGDIVLRSPITQSQPCCVCIRMAAGSFLHYNNKR